MFEATFFKSGNKKNPLLGIKRKFISNVTFVELI